MATKLSQILAVEKGVKADSHSAVTKDYQRLGKTDQFYGLSRTHQPINAEDLPFPSESTRVQVTVDQVLKSAAKQLTRLFDVVATKDEANTVARADIKLSDGSILLASVPVTYLLFLEKQLTELHALVSKLPTLPTDSDWEQDGNTGLYKTPPVETRSTKKVRHHYTKAEATKEHPAQAEMYTEDETSGHWTLVRFSGAIPPARLDQLLGRVQELQRAVKYAREEANGLTITDKEVGKTVFDYLFA